MKERRLYNENIEANGSLIGVNNANSVTNTKNATDVGSVGNATDVGSAGNATDVGSAGNATDMGSAGNATIATDATDAVNATIVTGTTGATDATGVTDMAGAAGATGATDSPDSTDTTDATDALTAAIATDALTAAIATDATDANIELLLADMAVLFVTKEGEKLLEENRYYCNKAPFPISTNFDRRVLNRIRMDKYKRSTFIISSIAASILILFISFNVLLNLNKNLNKNGDQSQAPNSQLADSLLDGDNEGERVDSSPNNVSSGSINFEMINLTFELPPGYSILDVKQDKGETIYHIQNPGYDNVIMTLEKSVEVGGTGVFDADMLIKSGLCEIEMNNTKLYAIAKTDFSKFVFQKEDIIYNMTCKNDYNTIISLCEYFI